MNALGGFTIFFALFTAQFDTSRREQGAIRRRVDHLDQSRVKIDLRRQSGYGNQGCCADGEDRRHCLVEKTFVAVRRFFQNEHVAASAFGRANLPGETSESHVSKTVTRHGISVSRRLCQMLVGALVANYTLHTLHAVRTWGLKAVQSCKAIFSNAFTDTGWP